MELLHMDSPEIRALLRDRNTQYQILDVFGFMADANVNPGKPGEPIELDFKINGQPVSALNFIRKVNERADAAAKYAAISDVYSKLKGDSAFADILDRVEDFQNSIRDDVEDLLTRNFPGEWSASSMNC